MKLKNVENTNKQGVAWFYELYATHKAEQEPLLWVIWILNSLSIYILVTPCREQSDEAGPYMELAE